MPQYKKNFYLVTAISVMTTLFFQLYSSANFAWLMRGSTRTAFWVVAGPVFLHTPLASIVFSFVVKKESFYRTFTIINGLLVPVQMFLAFTTLS